MAFDLTALNAQLANDPEWQALVQHYNANRNSYAKYGKGYNGAASLPFTAYLQSKGIEVPNDIGLDLATGQLNQSWTNTGWGALGLAGLVGAGMLGGAAAVPALAGSAAGASTAGAAGAATGGDAAATGGALASTALPAGYVAPVAAGSGLSAGAGAGIGAGTAGTFGKFVTALGGTPALVGTGLNLLGSYLQSRAVGNATDAQIAQEEKALATQAQMFNENMGLNVGQANQRTQAYNQTQSNLAPYRGIGASALSALGFGEGLPGYEQGNRMVVNAPAPVVPVQPLALPPPITLANLGTTTGTTPQAAYIPTTQQTQGMPQVISGGNFNPSQAAPMQSASSVTPGTTRQYNGQTIVFDGKGWKYAQQGAA